MVFQQISPSLVFIKVSNVDSPRQEYFLSALRLLHQTVGPAVARAFKGGSAIFAEKGGRATAVSRHGSAWSKSVA